MLVCSGVVHAQVSPVTRDPVTRRPRMDRPIRPTPGIPAIAGQWEGTYGTGESNGPGYFAMKFNTDWTLEAMDQNGTVYAKGSYSLAGDQFNGTYVYRNGASFTLSGVLVQNQLFLRYFNPANVSQNGRILLSVVQPKVSIGAPIAAQPNPAPPPPPATRAPPPPPASTPANLVYYLASARVSIRSGESFVSDDKVSIILRRPAGACNDDVFAQGCALYQADVVRGSSTFKPRATADVGLTEVPKRTLAPTSGVIDGRVRYANLLLDDLQTHGLTLSVILSPAFPSFRSWQIEKVSLTLEFKDVLGRPHPTLGTVVIPFVPSTVLNDRNLKFVWTADRFFMPRL
jgi:hypothetical protein